VGQGRDIESAWKDAAGIIVGDDKCLESTAGSADERLMVTQDATVGDISPSNITTLLRRKIGSVVGPTPDVANCGIIP